MTALETLRGLWLWGMLALGVFLAWMVWLAHYSAPERPEPAEGEDAPPPQVDAHEFPHGILEHNHPVPRFLTVFFVVMFVWAFTYSVWIQVKVGTGY